MRAYYSRGSSNGGAAACRREPWPRGLKPHLCQDLLRLHRVPITKAPVATLGYAKPQSVLEAVPGVTQNPGGFKGEAATPPWAFACWRLLHRTPLPGGAMRGLAVNTRRASLRHPVIVRNAGRFDSTASPTVTADSAPAREDRLRHAPPARPRCLTPNAVSRGVHECLPRSNPLPSASPPPR